MPENGICAHRGANNTHPENTLAAFREAIRLGAHMIEFDVDLTSDGYPVLMHDATVDRTTDGVGLVTDLTFAAIRQLDAGSRKDPCFAGEQIPTLDEALDMMPQNIWLNIHVKGGREAGKIAALAVLKQKRMHQAFLATSIDATDGARLVVPDIFICNMENQGYDTCYIDETIAIGCCFIQLYGGKALAVDIERLKRAGVYINYFFSNDAEELKELFEQGIDFVLADKSKEMLDVAETVGIPLLKPYRGNNE
jgi:glycerophosphoryl diester phosphodiesterase